MELKQLRKKYTKFTQEEFAKQLGINYETYRSYELNKRKPPIDLAIQIADFYNITLDYLYNRKFEGSVPTEEYNLLEIYRQLDNNRKQQTIGWMKSELSDQNRETKNKEISIS